MQISKRMRLRKYYQQKFTRRLILRQVSSIYDPLVFLTPFTLKSKLLMRDLMSDVNCDSKKLTWDEAVSPSHYYKWKMMFKEMFELESIKCTQCLKPCNAIGNLDLIVFADGSTKAYGAVAYAR